MLSTDNQTRRECVTKARLRKRLSKSTFAVKRQSGVTQGCHISQARKETGRSQKHPRRSQLIQDQSTRVQSVGLCCLVARYGGLEQYNRVQSVPWCCLVVFCSSLEQFNRCRVLRSSGLYASAGRNQPTLSFRSFHKSVRRCCTYLHCFCQTL